MILALVLFAAILVACAIGRALSVLDDLDRADDFPTWEAVEPLTIIMLDLTTCASIASSEPADPFAAFIATLDFDRVIPVPDDWLDGLRDYDGFGAE